MSFLAILIALVLAATVLAFSGKTVEQESSTILGWIEPVAAVVTAFGTVVLGAFTIVLARETKRLADVGEQPNIIVTFEPNRHSLLHLDMHVENTGTATAYEVEINIAPELHFGKGDVARAIPLKNISLLKSKQSLSSYFADWAELEPKAFTVTTSWLRRPKAATREQLSYKVDLEQLRGISRLGSDPAVDTAKATTKIAEGVDRISRGYSKVAVNTYNSQDRADEEKAIEERYNRAHGRNKPSSDATLTTEPPSPESKTE
jgi:hypothetical protein